LRAGALKGVDAAAHQALSGEYECHLLPAVDCHADYQTQPFRFELMAEHSSAFRRVLSTANVDLQSERDFPKLCGTVPMIAAVWFQLGYGEVYGGGHSYGQLGLHGRLVVPDVCDGGAATAREVAPAAVVHLRGTVHEGADMGSAVRDSGLIGGDRGLRIEDRC
jgi:hypothetical protein